MKILLLGDFSNCHATLAKGLKEAGHKVVTVACNTPYSDVVPDITIKQNTGTISRVISFLENLNRFSRVLKGFDIVAFAYPQFIPLHPQRLMPLLQILKKKNGALFYTAMNHDVSYIEYITSPSNKLYYNEWFENDHPTDWFTENQGLWNEFNNTKLIYYQNSFFEMIDGALSVLYEYHLGLEHKIGCSKLAYGGIPIDIVRFYPEPTFHNEKKIKIFLGRNKNRIKMKGTHFLEEAALKIANRFPDKVEFTLKEDLLYYEFISNLMDSDIILDQTNSFTPATTALIAMAMGKTVLSGAEPEYYRFIKEDENMPIINVKPNVDYIVDKLDFLVTNPYFLKQNSTKSREFVIKHNDYRLVAKRFLDFWTSKI